MHSFKGIIALDIDGTVTVERHTLEKKVATYLNHLTAQGWRLLFATGRTFSFAQPLLSALEGNYFLAPQNGAALYEMPAEKCVKKHYLSTTILKELDPFFRQKNLGLLVESGKENQDICYYNPSDFSPSNLEYLKVRMEIAPERWVALDSFTHLPVTDFAVGKFFATELEAVEITEGILKAHPLSIIVIRDPFRPGSYLAHINAFETSKGHALQECISLHPPGLPVIAAGDDYNDMEMLERSTVKIVMKNGPEPLHRFADVLAPPAQEQGIIQGLEEGIWMVSSK